MTRWHLFAAGVAVVLMIVSIGAGLRFSHAAVLFGAVSLAFAYPLIQWAKTPLVATLSLLLLAIFASFPLKKLFQLDGLVEGGIAMLVCAAAVYVAGFGWKRSWS